MILACNMPLSENKIPQAGLTTAQSMASSLQPSLQAALTQAGPDMGAAATLLAKNTSIVPPSSLNPTVESSTHETPNPQAGKPGEPGKAILTIHDFNTGTLADQQRSNDDYYDMNLLERPFDTHMTYRGDVDIQTAEIFKDSDYYYFTLSFLVALSYFYCM